MCGYAWVNILTLLHIYVYTCGVAIDTMVTLCTGVGRTLVHFSQDNIISDFLEQIWSLFSL